MLYNWRPPTTNRWLQLTKAEFLADDDDDDDDGDDDDDDGGDDDDRTKRFWKEVMKKGGKSLPLSN